MNWRETVKRREWKKERERERDVASWGQVNHERRLSLGPWKTQGQCPVVPTVKIRHWGPQAAGELYPNLFLSDVSISRTNQAEKPGPEGGSETGFIKSTPASSTIELAAECLGEGGGGVCRNFQVKQNFRGRMGSSRNMLGSSPETVLTQDFHFFSRVQQILSYYLVMNFVTPVVFYEITNVQCVYWSNSTIFIGRI